MGGKCTTKQKPDVVFWKEPPPWQRVFKDKKRIRLGPNTRNEKGDRATHSTDI